MSISCSQRSRTAERLIGLVLERSQYVTAPELADFIARRVAQGEPIDPDTFDGHVTAPVAERIDELLANPGVRVPAEFRAAFSSWNTERSRRELLNSLDACGSHRSTTKARH